MSVPATRPDVGHGHHHHHHRSLPSGEGTVVLDIGGSVGALIVHAPAALEGVEIELARRGETHQFVHTEVRERHVSEEHVYAGVFVEVPAGEYTLLDPPPGVDPDVVVEAGHVAQVHWEYCV